MSEKNGTKELLYEVQSKIEKEKREDDITILQQIVEPLAEAIEELAESIKEVKNIKPEPTPDYFDRNLGATLSTSIEKVFNLIQRFKQPDIKIDLSPITSIAGEIKKGNDSILSLIGKLSNNNGNGQYDELCRLLTAMISRQNIFIEKGFQTNDYTEPLKGIENALVNKNVEWEITVTKYNKFNDRIEKVIFKPLKQ